MPLKTLRRKAGSSLYRWVAVRLLQKRLNPVHASSSLKSVPSSVQPVSCERVSIDSVEQFPEAVGQSRESPKSLSQSDAVVDVDEVGFLEVGFLDTTTSKAQNDGTDVTPDAGEESAGVCSGCVSSSLSHKDTPKASPKYSSQKATKSRRVSSSPSSFNYEQAVTDDEGDISSYRPRRLSSRNCLNDSLGSSLPSIYALSKVSSLQEFKSLTYQHEKFSNDDNTNCSETLSDNNDDFPSEEISKVGYDCLETPTEVVERVVFEPQSSVNEQSTLGEIRSTKVQNVIEIDRVSVPVNLLEETEADFSISAIETSTELQETPTRAREIQKRLLNEAAPTRGSVQSLNVQALCNGCDAYRKWDSIGVLYGKEFTDIRNKVRDRLLCLLRERRDRKNKREAKRGPCLRPAKRRGLRRKQPKKKRPEKRSARNVKSRLEKFPLGEKKNLPQVTCAEISVRSVSESPSYHRVSDSLSKRGFRRSDSPLTKSYPSSSPVSSSHVDSLKADICVHSNSPSLLSVGDLDRTRHTRGSPPPCSPSFGRRTGADNGYIFHPDEEDKESPTHKSFFNCCPCFISLYHKVTKLATSSERHGHRHNREFSSDRRHHRHPPRRRHSSRSPSSDTASRRRRRHHRQRPHYRDSYTNSHVSISNCIFVVHPDACSHRVGPVIPLVF